MSPSTLLHQHSFKVASFICAMGLSQFAHAQYVVPSSQFPTIESAIEKASNGSQIFIKAGLHTPGVTLDAEGKNIHFLGETDLFGNPLTIISGSNVRRIMNCKSGESSQTIYQNLSFEDGQDQNAGALYIVNANPMILNCAFINNSSGYLAGAMYTGAGVDITVDSCLFMGNYSGGGGGVMNRESKVKYNNCMFIQNQSSEGAGLRTTQSNIQLTNCSFIGNRASLVGGGAQFSNGTAILSNCFFQENEARNGGGVYSSNNNGTYTSCSFDSNYASWGGGGSHEYSSNQTFYDSCSFINNHAVTEGGGLLLWDDQADLFSCTFEGNSCNTDGGGIMMKRAEARIHNTNAKNNKALGTGGFLNLLEPTVHLMYVKVEENEANVAGGIYVSPTSNSNLSNTSVCDNTPDQIIGPWFDNGMNCVNAQCTQCACLADLNGDQVVDGNDLVALFGAWGNSGGAEDLNADGVVDSGDLVILLGSWGACP